MPLTSINPATGKRIAVYPTHSRAQIEQVLARAAKAQRSWRAASIDDRAALLRRLGAAFRDRRDALARLATDEMGKPITQARAEVEKCAATCAFFADRGAAMLASQKPAGAPPHSRIEFDALGTVLAIMPWNFPYWQLIRAAVPALLAGNTIVLKHAPSVPGCALALEKLFTGADFPRGVFQTLLVDVAPVPALIADDRIRAVTLTGSTRAGREVAALAGAALKPIVLELGGSDPFLVLEGADVAAAAELAAQARLINSGQSCICAKRLIVVRRHARAFEQQLIEQFAKRRVGDPTNEQTDVGPLARADLRANLERQVTRALRGGATISYRATLDQPRGFFTAPTILRNVRPGNAAFDEETFGPVAALVIARNEADAINLANDSAYGLGATVCTRDTAAAKRVARTLESGCVFVNELVRSTPELPFGGIKQSGFGRELGTWGVQAFTNIKTVVG
jgi:succinate-semialdehyde dehydrogenase/glutarate-semialdehyde dehydrogenase